MLRHLIARFFKSPLLTTKHSIKAFEEKNWSASHYISSCYPKQSLVGCAYLLSIFNKRKNPKMPVIKKNVRVSAIERTVLFDQSTLYTR